MANKKEELDSLKKRLDTQLENNRLQTEIDTYTYKLRHKGLIERMIVSVWKYIRK